MNAPRADRLTEEAAMLQRLILPAAVVFFTLTGSLAFAQQRQVAARAALNLRLPEVNLNQVALADVLEFVRDATGANLHVNWRAIEEVGVGKDTPVSIRLRGATVRKILSLVLTDAAGGSGVLSFYPADDVIEVTTQEIADSELITRVYPVEDLLVEVPDFNNAPDFNLQAASGSGGGGGGQIFQGGSGNEEDQGATRAERADQLISLIVDTIQPDIWAVNGGVATIRFFNGSLIVRAPRSVHEALGGRVD